MSDGKKREEPARTKPARAILRGGALGAITAAGVLLAAAAMIAGGLLKNVPDHWIAAVACFIGAAAAGRIAVGEGGGKPVLRAVGAGAALLTILLAGGLLMGEGTTPFAAARAVPAACLCGSAVGAMIGVGRRSKRQKRRPKKQSRPQGVYK